MNTLPQDFLVGAATAAHQVEGNNIHSDYWAMEHMKYGNFNEPSLDAVDHYNRYEEDIKMVAEAGLNAYRFSIEWARIVPKQGVYDENEIEHYRKVLTCCRENGVEPIVTMMHFTSPKWLIENGGWENEATVEAFKNYCQYVTEQLGDLMHYVCTINEANMGIQVAAISARYRAQMMAKMQRMQQGGAEEKKDLEGTAQVGMNFNDMMANMQKQKEENVEIFGTDTLQTFVSARTPEGDMLVIRAHQAARAAMKAVKPELQIGLTLHCMIFRHRKAEKRQLLKNGWMNLHTTFLISKRMISLVYRTTPVHSLDQTEFFRFRREQRSHRWIMNIIRKA